MEFRTCFIEKSVGSFLNKRNQGREAWGRTWEQQQNIRQATRKLDEKTVEAGELRSRIEMASSFRELFSVLVENRNLPLTPSKFVALYSDLPDILKRDLIDPTDLINLYWGGEWVRSTILLTDDLINAYLVDNRSRVMRSVQIPRGLAEAAEIYGTTASGSLSESRNFGSSIYSAERFFNIFWNLPESERTMIITDPDILLQLPKPITKVGFGSIPGARVYGIIGFESDNFDGVSYTTYPVRTTVLNNIRWKLAWEESDSLFKKNSFSEESRSTMDGDEF